MAKADAPLEFRLLGPIEVAHRRGFVQLGGRRQRALLALLLLERGRAVSSHRLIDELWDGNPPAGAAKTLRAYVSRLRSALGDTPVSARASGYAVEVAPAQLDSWHFEELLKAGREGLARGAAGLAAERLRAALALWRGPALADVAETGSLAVEARRLDELRLGCFEEWAEAELLLGYHADVVADLERLVDEEPLRERLWRHLVIALYRCDRQADALAAYRRARTLLFDELGLEPTEELRELERAVLRHEVAPAASVRERHNLRAQVSSFVGRQRELQDLSRLLREHRLVTLTGMGGAGKTRLASEEAARQVGAWHSGVWLVDLSAVSDDALVPTAIARTLDAVERHGVSALDGLLDHLRRAELLLFLDNCEHVVDACAEVVHEVLAACPDVRVLATSRVALAIPGELDYTVDPLPTPSEAATAEETERVDSVRLFLERARLARHDFAPAEGEMNAVARICRELDGLPLAVELAAAHARALRVDEIAVRLGDRFRFLRSWGRMVDPRHQTLRATIDWSYHLLDEDERTLLRRLAVFAGGFTIESAAAVCRVGDGERALQLVESLVASSVVVADGRDGLPRYRLLETIRDYAAERLDEAGESEPLRRAHAEWFLGVVRSATADYVRFEPRQQREGLVALDAERDNLNAALQWALTAGSDLALPLAAQLRHYWIIRGYVRPGLGWLVRALEASEPLATETRAAGLAGAALLARLAGDFAQAEALAAEGLVVGRAVGASRYVVTCLNVLTTLAGLAGNFESAHEHAEEAVGVARSLGSPRLEGMALFILAEAALQARRYTDVADAGGRALELARALDDRESMALVLSRLGVALAQEGRLDEAAASLGEALEHAGALGFEAAAGNCCNGLALVAALLGNATRAARLLGAGESLQRAGGGLLLPADAAVRERALTWVREALPGDELERALEAGRRMSLADALEEAQPFCNPSARRSERDGLRTTRGGRSLPRRPRRG
jgi:predicted ATPase/DNA-binding SARP family transcriptional activator